MRQSGMMVGVIGALLGSMPMTKKERRLLFVDDEAAPVKRLQDDLSGINFVRGGRPHWPEHKKAPTKYDIEAVEKARLKRERKAAQKQ